VAVVDFDAVTYPFSHVFRDALLSNGHGDDSQGPQESGAEATESAKAEARRLKKEAMLAFQRRLRELPLRQLHLAVDPAWCAATSKSPLALPKGNISRFLMRRLRPLYTKFICDVVAPDIAAAMHPEECCSIYFQTTPCLRINAPSAQRATHPHCDAMYFHQPGQINYWLPLTGTSLPLLVNLS
jgi:hypothetical protein